MAVTMTMAWAGQAAAQSVVRQPYLQSLTPSSVYVVWTTDVGTNSRVRYGTDPANLTQTVDLGALATQHEVFIGGLAPDTRYYYSVGTSSAVLAGGSSSFYFETAPPVATPKKFRAWIIGDTGYSGSAPWATRDAMLSFVGAYRPNLFLHMGDMAYNFGTTDEFTNGFFAQYATILRNTVVWPTFGNHEGLSSDSTTQTGPYYTAYVLPSAGQAGGVPSGTEAYYSYDYANVHFVVLDGYGSSRWSTGAMADWLAADLAATDQDWIIAYMHFPMYTKGSHDSDEDWLIIEHRENLAPILEAGGVDLVLAGHSHNYERSFLVDGAYDTPTTAAGHIVDGHDGKPLGDGPYVKLPGKGVHEGTVHVVAGHGTYVGGAGGHPLMYFSEQQSGSCLLDVEDNRLTLSNIRYDGVISDRFAIVKGPALDVAAPDGGERLAPGGVYPIRWATSGNVPTVRLEYTTDDGATWTTIANNVANTGRYNWVVPSVDTSTALVRVSDAQNVLLSDESNAGFTIQSLPRTAVYFGDYWVYDDQGVDRGTAWRGLTYDDSSWKGGWGQLGYGDGGETTALYRATPSYPTAYFRKIIPIDGPVAQATMKLIHDDGVVVWLNGNQVASRRVSGTAYGDYAGQESRDDELSTVTLSPSSFVVGSNIIAVMVKQSAPSSTDLSFDMELTLTYAPPGGGTSSSTSSSSTTSSSTSTSSSVSSSTSTSSSVSSSTSTSSSVSSSTSTSSSVSSSTSSSTTSSSSASSSTSTSSTTGSVMMSSSMNASSTGSGGAGGAGPGGTPVCRTVQRGVFGTVWDATLWSGSANYQDGAYTSIYSGGGGTGAFRTALLWFNLSFIPAGAPVYSATLTINQVYKMPLTLVRLHQALAPWGETTVSWSSYNQSWDPLSFASIISGNGAGDRTADLTDMVTDWVNGVPNYGIVLEEDATASTQWRASEDTTPSRRPRLEVCYAE
ncbi:DNRLRE domain-containing protein [Sorangium sp. So ce1153]|uniref:DNRLRE domain-containing protein n=1 Tax=Sorangium sp. So ce1153 TaxID=3133333 RepID=UPI003F63842B